MTTDPAGLPLAPMTEWLREHVPAFDAAAPPAAQLLAGGRSNLTYLVTDAAGHRWAVRRPPLGHIMPSAHDLRREFTVLHAVEQAGYPVPRPWAICEDESVIGTRFLVMEFVDGLVIADSEAAENVTIEQADSTCQVLVAGLARLHALDADSIGLADFGRPSGYLSRQVRRWGEQWELSKTRELAGITMMASWLNTNLALLPAEPPWSIVHGDYRLDNAILDPSCSTLRAVLDWEMSTLGDPIADLAVALVYWTQADDHLRRSVPVAQNVTSGPGFWTREQIVERYATLTGRDLAHLGFCLVLACYKLAVIMESLHFRSRSGQQRGTAVERGEDMGGAVEALAQLGERLLDSPTVSTLSS
jgi:aminoglycoside phosphotransferase (APT) family kinase protein